MEVNPPPLTSVGLG
jgi:hypothetical protein